MQKRLLSQSLNRAAKFVPSALDITLSDYVHEVEHLAARIQKLDQAIEEVARSLPPGMRAVVQALQALRGIAQTAAVTIVAELG
ncbi:MAG: hypothetical protein HYX72_08990, partial [Acidobacteria bacterium]|nr:hypothetical protein [Acidobacteriota bacterium]